jgi:hypothetical protein
MRRLGEVLRRQERRVPHCDPLEAGRDLRLRGLIEDLLHPSHDERRVAGDLGSESAGGGVERGAAGSDPADQTEGGRSSPSSPAARAFGPPADLAGCRLRVHGGAPVVASQATRGCRTDDALHRLFGGLAP